MNKFTIVLGLGAMIWGPLPGNASERIREYVDPSGILTLTNVGPPAAAPRINPVQPWKIQVEHAARAHFIDPALLYAIITIESNNRHAAVSPKGAIGLMQVIPATAERYGVIADAKRTIEQKLMDPSTNVRIGTRYLADLLMRFENDVTLALAGYNAGEHAVERYDRRVPPYRETQAYVVIVQQFRDLYAPPPAPPPKPSRVVIPRRAAPP